jgi:hypothetical protein
MLPLVIISHNLRQAAGFGAGKGNRVMTGNKLADRLDWNAMLGFEQIVDSRESLRSATEERIGAKVGEKPTGTISAKTGLKPTTIATKTGAKPILIGSKTGIKPTGIGTKTGIKPVN